MLDLLEGVGLAIGHMNLRAVAAFIDGSVVVVEVESLISAGEDRHLVGLRFDAQIAVAGVVPAALIETGNRLAGVIFCERRRPLLIAVEVVVAGLGHARVIEVAGTMPDAVLLLDAHMAHLHWEKVFEDRLPNPALIDVGRDSEGLGDRVAEGHLVHPRLLDLREVELGIFVANKVSPRSGRR